MTNSNLQLKESIGIALKANASLRDLLRLIRSFKEAGGRQEEAYSALEELRNDLEDESLVDRLLEVMDFVSGFCPVDQRIW